ncbi:5-oxoprolinase subunit PxpA [Pseudomonas vanderleydeniana]|uniref:5-oxoprolinase subunit A n=1 Tax=Pseudomonas vanderleydeniana TaxID=2745495 RepID=A0A9E6PPU3_9PSED|nr:5-oxoprolinase subunit PxpA [Pseudomonas vanderleydeniana]QXI29995.1 LamB/YcsF family protein [Pseudomonas vanderleydeniana]
MSRLLLNCDIGESYGNWTMGLDAQVMPFIDFANIACGYHAGDPSIMRKTVSLALANDVRIGAHPAYPDLVGFGRRSMACTPQEIQDLLHYQIGALDGICRAQGARVSYVKPHGALYNDMMANPQQLRSVIQAIAAYDRELPLMLLAMRDNSAAQAVADEFGVTLWFEAFADRAYDPEGRLVSRQLPGAVHHESQRIIEQALTIARGDPLTASDCSALRLHADTLCVHGDNASSVEAVQRIREALDRQANP